jgi:hypothetical protein
MTDHKIPQPTKEQPRVWRMPDVGRMAVLIAQREEREARQQEQRNAR